MTNGKWRPSRIENTCSRKLGNQRQADCRSVYGIIHIFTRTRLKFETLELIFDFQAKIAIFVETHGNVNLGKFFDFSKYGYIDVGDGCW